MRQHLRFIAAGAAAGILAFLAFPPADSGWLAFIALVPLYIAFRRCRPGDFTVVSTSFALTFFGLLITWIGLFGVPAYVALVLLQSFWVVTALAAGVFLKERMRPGWAMVAFPLALVVGEYLRSRFPLGGFAWGGFGYSQHDNWMMLRLAPFTGVWGLSLIVAGINALVGEGLLAFRDRPLPGAAFAGGALVLALLPGMLPQGAGATGRPARIAMVQGNVPEDTRDPNVDDLTVLNNHIRLTEQLQGQDPSLVIWAESSLDRDPFHHRALGDPLHRTIRETAAPFLVGSTLDAGPGEQGERYNTTLFFNPDASLAGVYAKQHLVPFGEWVPFRPLLEPLIRQIERVPFDTVPGKESAVFGVAEGKFASVICYESTFPGLVRSFVRNGARLLVVSTNNSSFERTAASEQHVAFSQLRAAEHKMWVAHTALSGISAVVDPHGKVIGRTELFRPALLVPTMRFSTGMTPYARMGDWVPLAAMGWLASLIAWAISSRAVQKGSGSKPEKRPVGGTLVVLPTYNEKGHVEALLKEILRVDPALSVLVVDDASPDGTGETVDAFARRNPRVQLLVRKDKRGLGGAYLEGFRVGLERGFDRFIEMDADFSHDPADLPRLIETSRSADLVIGSRYIEGGSVAGWSKRRHLLSRLGNVYASLVLRLPVKDSTSGFRCYRRRVLEAIDLGSIQSQGYAFQIEMAFRAWKAGFSVKEVPIMFKDRADGQSKMSRAIVKEAIVEIARWGLRERLGRTKSEKRRVNAGN